MFSHRSFLVLGGGAADIVSLIKGGLEISNCNFSFVQDIDNSGKATTRSVWRSCRSNYTAITPTGNCRLGSGFT